MDLIMIPQALLVFYGAIVLGGGGVLGYILGRNRNRSETSPEPPELLERRIQLLEEELTEAQLMLGDLKAEREFMRKLRSPEDRTAAA